jgi:CoA:oxalate CoA-transferase
VSQSPLCLTGIKVIDLTQVIAGPYGAMQLAMLGADVVKIETPLGDPMRWRGGSDPMLAEQGLSTHYQAHACGRSVKYLDWTTESGIADLKNELTTADVFICNLRTHVLPARGLSDDVLRDAFPRLIVCKLSGYTDNEECAEWPAYDNTVQAASGLMRLTGGAPEGARVGAPILDYATGIASVSAILAALFERERSGRGQIVKVNMLAVAHQLTTAQRFDMSHTGKEPRHKGNRANSGEPLSMVFETAEGHLALAVNEEHQFRKFAQALGDSRVASDPRFATRKLRRDHPEALQSLVQAALRARGARAWEQHFNREGVAAAAVRTLAESIAHPGAETNPALFRMERGAMNPEALQSAQPYRKPATASAHQSQSALVMNNNGRSLANDRATIKY